VQAYQDLLAHVLEKGDRSADRTGTGTLSVFGHHAAYDLREGFPLVTTKRVAWRAVARELLWFVAGETNIRPLLQEGVRIWSAWPHRRYAEATGDRAMTVEEFEARVRDEAAFAARWGDLGPVYGASWRRWRADDGRHVDQLAEAVRELRQTPWSRRIIICSWNPGVLDRVALPPCHAMVQFDARNGMLNAQLYQRSADLFLGVPFNIACYAMLVHMVAQAVGLQPGVLHHCFGNLHLYLDHLDQAREQLARTVRPLPRLRLDPDVREVWDFGMRHIAVEGYDPHPAIRAPVAV